MVLYYSAPMLYSFIISSVFTIPYKMFCKLIYIWIIFLFRSLVDCGSRLNGKLRWAIILNHCVYHVFVFFADIVNWLVLIFIFTCTFTFFKKSLKFTIITFFWQQRLILFNFFNFLLPNIVILPLLSFFSQLFEFFSHRLLYGRCFLVPHIFLFTYLFYFCWAFFLSWAWTSKIIIFHCLSALWLLINFDYFMITDKFLKLKPSTISDFFFPIQIQPSIFYNMVVNCNS